MIAKIQEAHELQREIWESRKRKTSMCKNWKIVPSAQRDGEERWSHSIVQRVERIEGNENTDENRRYLDFKKKPTTFFFFLLTCDTQLSAVRKHITVTFMLIATIAIFLAAIEVNGEVQWWVFISGVAWSSPWWCLHVYWLWMGPKGNGSWELLWTSG